MGWFKEEEKGTQQAFCIYLLEGCDFDEIFTYSEFFDYPKHYKMEAKIFSLI